jgi:hypothetical protein
MAARSSHYERFVQAMRNRRPATELRAIIEGANSVDDSWLFQVISNYPFMDYVRNPPVARELALLLIDKGIPIDEISGPSIWPSLYRLLNRPFLDSLLERGLDVNMQSKRDGTPLISYVVDSILSCENAFLIELAQGGDESDTYTQYLNQNVISLIDVFHRLVQQGAELSSADKMGVTALFRAIKGPYTPRTTPIIEAVLEASDVNRQDSFGNTPLMALVQGPAEDGLQFGERTPIQIAQLLLAHGADPTIRNEHGRTAADLISMDEDDYNDNEEAWRQMTELANFLREQERQWQGQQGGRKSRKGRKTRKGRKGGKSRKGRKGGKSRKAHRGKK